MKHHALFPKKNKSKKIKCRLLQFSFAALRVKQYSFLLFLLYSNNIIAYLEQIFSFPMTAFFFLIF